jgi:hypothetical protein
MPSSDFDFMEEQKQKHYSAVGKVAIEWTRFEMRIAEMVRMLAGVDNKYGKCITTQVANTARMLDALSALAELRCPGSAGEKPFKKRLDHIQGLAERRNRVVHDEWTFDPGINVKWQNSARRVLKDTRIDMSTDEVERLATEIIDAHHEFAEFRREFLMPLNLWPGS